MTESLRDRIIRHEGKKLVVYDDATGKRILPGSSVAGHPTIGIGRALDVNGISSDEADYFLDNDIASAKQQLLANYPATANMDEVRQGVLIEMIFQLGIGGVAKFPKMWAAINNQDWAEAANQMLDSAWHKQTPERAEELASIMLHGDDV
jgi:lysozyme